MKKCYLDSNILIYFKDKDSNLHTQTKNLIKNLFKENFSLAISPLVLDEFLHSLNWVFQQKKLPKNKGSELLQECLNDILNLPDLEVINPPNDIKSQKEIPTIMEQFDLRPREAYHFLTMSSDGIEVFATFDNDFEYIFEQQILKSPL